MYITIGQWELEVDDGYFSVSFPMGEHVVNMFYSAHGKTVTHFVQVDIDDRKLARIDLPEEQHVTS